MMPRARKEKSLTPEEKRAQTLVPEEEQPYPVPENWRWVRLGELYEINPKNQASDNIDSAFVPMEKISFNMTGAFTYDILPWSKARKGHTQFADGDVAFAKISPCFENRKSMLVRNLPNGIGGGTTELFVLRQPMMNQKYTFYLVNTDEFIRGGCKTYSGTVGQQRISMEYVRRYPFPVPPITEQQRIVDRLDRLFAALDAAKEKAQSVLAGCETRKAAILHKAFTGELIGLRNKSTVPFASIIDTIRIGPFGSALHKDDYIVGGIPLVNPKHISRQRITIDEHTSITPEKAAELDSYRLKTGDIVMGRRGEMGRSAPVTEKENGWLCGTGSLIIRLQKGYDASFYSQIIASHSSVQYLEENSVGSTMKNLNEKVVKSLPVPNFTQAEQKIIVSVLNKIMEKEQSVTAVTQSVLAQIDALKRSILARAFRGELGTGDPADPPAPLPE